MVVFWTICLSATVACSTVFRNGRFTSLLILVMQLVEIVLNYHYIYHLHSPRFNLHHLQAVLLLKAHKDSFWQKPFTKGYFIWHCKMWAKTKECETNSNVIKNFRTSDYSKFGQLSFIVLIPLDK